MKVKSEREVAQLCLTLRDPMDCSPPGSSAHRFFQARVLEWGAIAFSVNGNYTTLIVESEDLDQGERGEQKAGLKVNIEKSRIMAYII